MPDYLFLGITAFRHPPFIYDVSISQRKFNTTISRIYERAGRVVTQVAFSIYALFVIGRKYKNTDNYA